MTDRAPKIYIAGHFGMVGSAIVRTLVARGYPRGRIVTRAHSELDLTDQRSVRAFFDDERPDQVYLAAARVGGILANHTYPADFIYTNLAIQTNVIHSAFSAGVKQLLFLGSSCIYPRSVEQPMREEALLTGPLEPTNEPYAIAKIAGIKMCESYNRQYATTHGLDYRCVMPTNLYGPGDNYHPDNSHVIPGLIRRFHEAKINQSPSVTVWGTGTARREFLYVDDLATACVHVMNLPRAEYARHTTPSHGLLNVGSGTEVSIGALASTIATVVGYRGAISFDTSKPDGAPRKLIDSERLRATGWVPEMGLERGLALAYESFISRAFEGTA
jgi:GDP-L-fucose synthase